ncbi:hypothetical protein PSS62_26275, partial [Enterobacter hormaechei subsp. xiangfangensis]|nr:hypothetical protein [Enterobacter hormaechei subsp. xiangfangensis]
DADMVIGDDIPEGDDDGSRIAFEWKTESKKYRRSPSKDKAESCLLYTSPSPRDYAASRMPSSA